MEGVLWYVLTGTRGGENRTRILDALDDKPRNPNQLAEDLDLDYTTVQHHLEVLEEHDIVERPARGTERSTSRPARRDTTGGQSRKSSTVWSEIWRELGKRISGIRRNGRCNAMAIWLDLARLAAAVNVLLLVGLSYVWGKNAAKFRTKHTYGLVTFSLLLLVENALTLYMYTFDPTVSTWMEGAIPFAQAAMLALRGVELVALVTLSWAVWD